MWSVHFAMKFHFICIRAPMKTTVATRCKILLQYDQLIIV